MKILKIIIFLLLAYSCTDGKNDSNTNEDKTIEVIKRTNDADLDIFIGDNFFKNKEANELNSKGIELIKEFNYKQAEKYFIEANRIEPENPIVLTNLGNLYREIGTEKMALEYYNEAFIASDSTYFNAAYNMGISYCNLDDYEKSEVILNYLISNTTNEDEIIFAKYVLIRVYVNQGKCRKANELYSSIHSDLDKFPEFKE